MVSRRLFVGQRHESPYGLATPAGDVDRLVEREGDPPCLDRRDPLLRPADRLADLTLREVAGSTHGAESLASGVRRIRHEWGVYHSQ